MYLYCTRCGVAAAADDAVYCYMCGMKIDRTVVKTENYTFSYEDELNLKRNNRNIFKWKKRNQ